jgi:hypothetical protein
MNNEWNRKHNPVPWCEVLDKKPHDWRTRDGKLGKHTTTIWLRFVCSDTSCGGIIAVRGEDILADAPTGFKKAAPQPADKAGGS